MFIAGGIFAVLAVLSAICKVTYRGVEGKSPEDVEDDIQKMLRAKSRLLENWNQNEVHENRANTIEYQQVDTIKEMVDML